MDAIAQALTLFETVRKRRASITQIYSDTGGDEPEKIREKAKLYVESQKIPSTSTVSLFRIVAHHSGTVVSWNGMKWIISGEVLICGGLASIQEFSDTSFGYDVFAHCEQVMKGPLDDMR